MYVPGDDPETPETEGGWAGDLIEFYVGGEKANLYDVDAGQWLAEYPWESGRTSNLDLDVDKDLDFGDAPDLPYPTLLASNGARHVIVPGFFLGASVDAEPDGQPDATATGDDLDGNDDEDGVVFTSPLTVGSLATVDVTASASGLLDAWMDFNADGDWADPGEQIFGSQALVAGLNSLSFGVPGGATLGQTFARFRFSTMGGLPYEGPALNGEVEDYRVEIVPPPIDVELIKMLLEPAGRAAEVGEEIWFQVLVENTGQTAFVANPFTDAFDEACMSFLSAEQDLAPVPGVGPGSPLQWDLAVQNGGPIIPGQKVQIDVRFKAEVVGICLNEASVTEFDEWEQEASDSDDASVDIAELDFGDAPDPLYPTLLASNGARHIIVPGFFLGASVDAEPDGQPDATATGDDLDGNDDEDGVVFTSSLNPGGLASVDVTASASGLLDAWMDFNADGDWADPGEQIFASQALVAGVNNLTFPVPGGAVVGQTFARFRFSSVGGLSYEGLAPDGEVEDYQVEIVPPIDVDLTKVLLEPAGGLAFVGDEVWFQVLVENTGQTAFVANPFTDAFDEACMSFLSAEQDGAPVPGVGPVSPLQWDLAVQNGGPIIPGQVVTIDVRFKAEVVGVCLNQASVTEIDEWEQEASDSDDASVEIAELDFGDAPENGLAYPTLGVQGQFPTCQTVGPAAWVQHGLGWAHFTQTGAPQGPWDAEPDGNAGLCPNCFPTYDDDECYLDGDAGLMFPEPFTIDPALNVVPCPNSLGTPLGATCATAVWGVDVDISVVNGMPCDGFVNVLMDWDQLGQWGGASQCPAAAAPEHVLVDFPVPMGYNGPLSALMPAGTGFLIGPNSGYVWTRFSVTERPVGAGWDGSGAFEDGESEDYLLEVIQSGTIIVEKAPDLFTFSGDAAGSIADGGQIVVSNLLPGTYTSQETVPSGWNLTDITCDDGNSSPVMPLEPSPMASRSWSATCCREPTPRRRRCRRAGI
jgi:hypothetical protein